MEQETGRVPGAAEVADRLAVLEVLGAHSRGLDRQDVATLTSCYWPEAEVDYGAFKGSAHTFAELVVPILGEQYELTRHGIGNTLFRFSGDEVRTETYVHATHLEPGATEEILVYGRYLDHMVRRDGCWKILHRTVMIEWSNRLPVQDEREGEAFRDLTRGEHHPLDPLYGFLQAN
jgi:hypothetical protein